ncbi:MAG: hypothetical protein ABJZ69_19715 [Hyphomicrobiales bacterium]
MATKAELCMAAAEARAATDALKKMARDPLGAFDPGLATTVAKTVIKNLNK